MKRSANGQIRAIVLTISDTRRPENDISGVTAAGHLLASGAVVVEKLIVTDELDEIRNTIFVLAQREDVDLVITTGGTGFSPRDNTPEATRSVIDREAPGIAEALRAASMKKTQMAMLSRGVCGIRDKTLIINLPGSPKAVTECFDVLQPVLQHAVDLIRGFSEH